MRLVTAFVLGLGLVFASSAAQAGKQMDWSSYIEAPGARTPVAAPTPAKAETEKPAKRAKVSKHKAKAKRSAVKARAKKRARK